MARLSAACRGARLTDGLFPFAEDADGLSGPWRGEKKEKENTIYTGISAAADSSLAVSYADMSTGLSSRRKRGW